MLRSASLVFLIGTTIGTAVTSGCGAASGPRPEVVAQGQDQPIALAVNAEGVFWIDSSGAVMTAPRSGGTPVMLAMQENSDAVAADDRNVYWCSGNTLAGALSGNPDGQVLQMPAGGGAPIVLASGQPNPAAIAVDATTVYWVNWGDSDQDGAVMSVPIGGGTAVSLAFLQPRPAGIAVDATSVYWINQGVGSATSTRSTTGAVMSASKSGGFPATLASGLAFPVSIATDATNVYWIDQGTWHDSMGAGVYDNDGAVLQLPKSGGSLVALATGLHGPQGLAVDDHDLYWTLPGAGTISKLPLGESSAATTLASGQSFPQAITVDASAIYWVDHGSNARTDGSVVMLAK